VRGLRRKPNNAFLKNVQGVALSAEEKIKNYNEMLAKERDVQLKMHEFEGLVARRTHLVADNKSLSAAVEKLEAIFKLELHPSLAKSLAAFLVKNLGHEVIEQLHAQGKLKEFLVKSPALKANILTLKSGKRIQKNLFEASAEDLKKQLEEEQ
ncbi:MAG: hypothetical protein WCI04_06860, partial [archaeon]